MQKRGTKEEGDNHAILRLTETKFTFLCGKRKFACEALMKQIIEDIRLFLKEGAFKDEQHVRFSLVGRLCLALGWNIWNPDEFNTEYRVKRLPQQNITKDVTGRVDVALFIPEKTSEGAEVFIEVKTPGKLDSDLIAGENQLHLYNAYHKSAISILTDGIKWRFYLPSAGGEFDDKLFNELNMLEDNPDDIVQTFEMILKKENYRIKALNTAEDMRNELVRIKLIANVKDEAIAMHIKTDLSAYMFAQQLIKKNHKVNIELEDIERLWDKKQSGIKHNVQEATPIEIDPSIHTEPLKDYRFTKVHFVVLCGKGRITATHWHEVKRTVYNFLLKHKPGFHVEGSFRYSKDKSDFRVPLTLNDGFFTEGNLGSTDMVRHARTAMQAAGFDPIKDLIIGITYTDKRKA